MLRDDILSRACAFDQVLKSNGLTHGADRVAAFIAGISGLRPMTARGVFFVARASMTSDHSEWPAFRRLFDTFWLGELAEEAEEREREREASTKRQTDKADDGLDGAGESVPVLVEDQSDRNPDDHAEETNAALMASSDGGASRRDFALMSEGEVAEMFQLQGALHLTDQLRPRTREKTARSGGRLDLRRTLSRSLRHMGEPMALVRRKRRQRPRPIVLICDVSESMSPYARAMLRYAHLVAQSRPRVRAYAFSTGLVDVSPALAYANADRAMQDISRRISVLGTGTRIAAALALFNRHHLHNAGCERGTVVILSDGWEVGSPELLQRQMRVLTDQSRRTVWVNPRMKDPKFQPLTQGMIVVAPLVDRMLAGHSLDSLAKVAQAIRLAEARD